MADTNTILPHQHHTEPLTALRAVRVAYDIVPLSWIAEVNALIDAEHRAPSIRPANTPPSGLVVAPATAQRIGERLRAIDAFRMVEIEACAGARNLLPMRHAPAGYDKPFHLVRCVDRSTARESHCRHFDSHLLTFLVPLQRADPTTFNGDLLVYHPTRPIPSTAVNIATKVVHGVQRNLPLSLRRQLTVRDLDSGRCERFVCTPGNVYLFNGFLMQHANLDVESGQRRSLLIHWYDPGRSGGLSTAMRAFRRACDKLRGA